MSLPKTAVGRPVTVVVIFTLIIGLGLYILPGTPIDLYPDFNPPVLVVMTDYSGAGPKEVENSVTRIIEGYLSNVSDLQEMTSTSSEGRSTVILNFDWDKDMTEAGNDVRDRLEYAKAALPTGSKTPVVYKFDPSMIPIFFLAVEGSRSPDELKAIAENIIQPKLEQIRGVALTSVSGGRQRIIKVEVSKNRLEAYSLTMGQISQALASQNIDVGGGSVSSGSIDYLVRTTGEYRDIEQLKESVIAYRGGSGTENPAIIKLRDVAVVSDSFEDETNVVFINGKPGVYVRVQKQSGSNSVQTADNVHKEIDRINKELPRGVSLKVLRDTTQIIKDSIKQVSFTALTGGLFAMAVLLIFLRSIKSTIVIGISIPVSLLVTLIGMYFAGITINILSLAGLTLGVGMIVDSSIVILENIFRYREKGSRLKVSAVLGSEEMKGAITASTLTTVCVFLPIVLFRAELGILGVMFNDLAFTVVVALVSSLFVALILVPVLSSRYLPIFTKKQRPVNNIILKKADSAVENYFRALELLYRKVLSSALNHRKTTIAAVAVLMIIAIVLIPAAGFEFAPSGGEDEVNVTIEMPVGTNLEITRQVVDAFEEIVKKEIKGYENLIKSTGASSGFFSGSSSYRGEIQITLPSFSERIDSSDDVKRKLRAYFNDFPGAKIRFSAGRGGGPGNINPIDILIKSDDMEKSRETARAIQKLIADNVPEATEPSTDINDGLPQVEVVLDRERLYELGLTAAAVGNEIKAAVNGITATKFRYGSDELDVVAILDKQDRSDIPSLERIFVTNSRGQYIPVSSVASLVKSTGPVDIKRIDQTRVLHVTSGIEKGAKLNEVQNKIKDIIDSNIVPDDSVVIEYAGDYGDLIEYGIKFAAIMVMALLLVYGVMASQFESYKDPFIMFLTVPLMIIGVVFIHLIMGKPFSMFTAVGLVMLSGIVVNNGIVLVDYTNLLINRGLTLQSACIEAGINRLRPILMTSLSTILGMTPLAFFPGEGADLVQPIGQTVIGGLVTSTVITLVFIPVMYYVFNRKKFGSRAGEITYIGSVQ